MFVIAALGVLVYGLWRDDWRWVLASALLYAPFALYLTTGPLFRWAAISVWVAFLLAGAGMKRNGRIFASLLALPAFGLAAVFAWVVAVTNP